jgi:hypothetical protein
MPGWDSTPEIHIKFQFDIEGGGGVDTMNISCKISNVKVLAHLGFKWKVLPGPLTKAPGLYYAPGA